MNDNTPICNICNFNQHPLLCNRCTARTVLDFQIKGVSVTEEIYKLCEEINGIITSGGAETSKASTTQLYVATAMESRRLQAQKSSLELQKVRCLGSIEEVKVEMRAVREQLAAKRRELEDKRADLKQLAASKTAAATASPKIATESNVYKNHHNNVTESGSGGAAIGVSAPKSSSGDNSSSGSGEKDYNYINYKKTDLALRLLLKLNSLFLISIKRNSSNRRGSTGEREVFISFNPIPNLSNLVKYTHNMLNSSFERLSYFCFFVSNYLGLLLPYVIRPPQRQQPITVILGKNGARFELKARDTIKKQIKERPKEFDNYAKGLSMLAIDLVFLCLYTGVFESNHANNSDTNTTNSITKRTLKYDCENMTEKALNIDENIYLLNIFLSNKNNYHHHHGRRQVPVHPLNSNKDKVFELPDLDEVWDLVVNKNYIEVNGNSAEWNLV